MKKPDGMFNDPVDKLQKYFNELIRCHRKSVSQYLKQWFSMGGSRTTIFVPVRLWTAGPTKESCQLDSNFKVNEIGYSHFLRHKL